MLEGDNPVCIHMQPELDHRGPNFLHSDNADPVCETPSPKKQILNALDSWVKEIRSDCALNRKHPDPCSSCFPEFTCLASFPYKKPFCLHSEPSPLITNIPLKETRMVSEKWRVKDCDDRVDLVWIGEDKKDDIPVWERPRIRSQKLIGGEYKKLTECFKNNGLIRYDCPRTESCQLIKSMGEWIEMDKRKHGSLKTKEVADICCCHGAKSLLPMFKCKTCGPYPPPPKRPVPTYLRCEERMALKKKQEGRLNHSHRASFNREQVDLCPHGGKGSIRESTQVWNHDKRQDLFLSRQ